MAGCVKSACAFVAPRLGSFIILISYVKLFYAGSVDMLLCLLSNDEM